MSQVRTSRVIVVEVGSLFFEGMRHCLEIGRHVVLAHSRNLEEALQHLDLHRPDLAVIGPNLPEYESLAVCREIICRWPDTKTVLFSPYSEDPLFQADAVYAGAAACLLPVVACEDFLQAVAAVLAGQKLFSYEVLAHGFQPIALTPRERDVLKLLAEGKTDREIADKLTLQTRTVRNHSQRLLEKLGVSGRKDALRRAHRRGWL